MPALLLERRGHFACWDSPKPVSYTHLDVYKRQEGVFTLDEAQSTLEMLFDKQYILTVTEEVEVRYRTETRTDSEGNEYDVEVAYNYYILNVDLELSLIHICE